MADEKIEELQARIAELESENLRLSDEAKSVASANVHAALELVELADLRREESEARGAQLEKALESAEAASRKKDEFLAKVSHELRTPLNGIVGMAGILLDCDLDDAQYEIATLLKTSGDNLTLLINDLLDVAKLESDRLEMMSIEFDLWPLVENVVQGMSLRRSESIEVFLEVDPETPRILVGDPDRLRQVLSNLLENALKFTEAGHVGCLVRRSGQTLLIEVSDTGCGVPLEAQPYIFDSFRQVDDSTRRRHGGSGLGLAVAKGLVTRMGGQISVTSDVDIGSTFHVEVPLLAAQIQPNDLDLRSLCIAALTQREWMGRQLRKHLESLGAKVSLLDDPEALIALGRSGRKFDVLLLDAESSTDEEASAIQDLFPQGRCALLQGLGDRPPSLYGREVGSVLSPLSPSEIIKWTAQGSTRTEAPTDLQRARMLMAAEAESGPLHVLVAEDNLINQRLVETLLIRLGCEVALAGDGREAVSMASEESFDLILMDCQMPELDGYQATAEIRSLEVSPNNSTRIVALTAHVLEGDRERCLQVGMNDYLQKPLRAEELARALCDCRREQRAAG